MGLARPHSILRKTSLLLIMAALCCPAHGAVIYVDAGARGTAGSSWQDALDSLQDALLLASFYEKPVEIRVARGVYRPDRGLGITPGDRTASFELMNGVTIKGGYAGARRPDPEARDVRTYETILTGDIGAPDQPDDNSFRVVTGGDVDGTAILDGCTITAANGEKGGGMANLHASPTVIDCTFRGNLAIVGAGFYNGSNSRPVLNHCVFSNNVAVQDGGAVYNTAGSSPILTSCTFVENSAAQGGAMSNYVQSNAALTSCVFRSNSAPGAGGGMSNTQSNPTLADCTFEENSTTGSGGGMVNDRAKPILLKCTFRANVAGKDGGAVYGRNGSQLAVFNGLFIGNSATVGGGMQNSGGGRATMTNCTFAGNSAQSGGALSNTPDSQTTLVSCILWGDTPSEIGGSEVTVAYSDVQGGWPGAGNIKADPLFADPNSDFHLKSQAGRWDPAAKRWVVDLVSSPCIDAGDQMSVIGIEPFPNGDRTNMGAYGGTFEASLSPSQPQQPSPAAGKASNPIPADGVVNVSPDLGLRWTTGAGAVAHDVYLGTTIAQVAEGSRENRSGTLVSMGQSGTTYVPPVNFAYGQSYYWRVDEIDGQGNITRGDVWKFATPAPPATTGKASNPVPADGAMNVSLDVVLKWTTGAGAVAHDVYFGMTFGQVAEGSRDNPAVLVSMRQSATSFDPGSLAYGQPYYWRVDEIDGRGNITRGDVWKFATPAPPATTGKASNPVPADGAVSVSTNVVLSWTAGSGALTHDVYLGTDVNDVALSSRDNPEGVLVSMGQSATTYDPPMNLAYQQSYYWRVDEIDGQGSITKGDVWMFKTASTARR
jgi:predicted outer membrane repeat protein